ncbi:MAG: transposase [Gemmatimonadales bacterium]|nr:MAG: transposase [Gemmatimonadales bacterium]
MHTVLSFGALNHTKTFRPLIIGCRQARLEAPDKPGSEVTVSAENSFVSFPPTLAAAEEVLAAFEARWDARFPMIGRKWRTNRANLTPFFDYPLEIRKVKYTTNAIEALNAQLRKVTGKRGSFPNPEAVRKVLYLAIIKASERWTRPVQDWPAALNHLAIVIPGRLPA